MSLAYYMDEHINASLSAELRHRGVDVLLAQEDGRTGADDSDLMSRATELGRVVFTHDSDFLRLAAEAQNSGTQFSGIVYAHVLSVSFVKALDDLQCLAHVLEPAEMFNRVVYLPLT